MLFCSQIFLKLFRFWGSKWWTTPLIQCCWIEPRSSSFWSAVYRKWEIIGLPYWLHYTDFFTAVRIPNLFLNILLSNTESGGRTGWHKDKKQACAFAGVSSRALSLARPPACLPAHWGRRVKLCFWIQFACFLHFQLFSLWVSAAFAEVQGLLWLALSGLHACLWAEVERIIPDYMEKDKHSERSTSFWSGMHVDPWRCAR